MNFKNEYFNLQISFGVSHDIANKEFAIVIENLSQINENIVIISFLSIQDAINQIQQL